MSFIINVNAERDNVVNCLKEYYKEDFFKQDELNNRLYMLNDYRIQIYYNESYDRKLAKTDKEYYLYYKVHLDFYFLKEKEKFIVENELKLIEELQQLFTKNNLENKLILQYN